MPLVLPAVAFVVGIAAQGWWPLPVQHAACAAMALALLAALPSWFPIGANRSGPAQTRQPRGPWLQRITLALSVAFGGAAYSEYRQPSTLPVLDASPYEVVELTGCVVQPSVHSPRREQFTVELMPGAQARVTLPLALGESGPTLPYGQRISFPARVRRPTNFRNPGGFDWIGYLARRDIFWTASVPAGESVSILPDTCGSSWQRWLFLARGWTLRRMETLYSDNPQHAAMLKALLLGDTSQVEQNWTEVFRRTGTYHALVLSGYHLTSLFLVGGLAVRLLWVLVARLGRWLPPFGSLLEELVQWGGFGALRQTVRYFVGLGLLWFYTLLALSPMPLLRASAAVTLFMAGQLLFRRVNPLQLLAVCGLAILLGQPSQVFDGSFHFTMLSMLCLLGLSEPLVGEQLRAMERGLREFWNDRLHAGLPSYVQAMRTEAKLLLTFAGREQRKRMRWTPALQHLGQALLLGAGLFFTSLAMQLGLAIPSILFFHRLPLLSAAANVPVAGLLSLAVPVGFLAVLTNWGWVARLAAWLVDAATWIGLGFAQFETFRVPDVPTWLLLTIASLLFMAGVAGARKHRWAWPAAASAALLVVFCVLYPFAPDWEPGQLEVTAIDVGQGEALLLVAPDGRTALVDAGGIPTFRGRPKPRLEIGEQVVSSYLWSRRFRRLDLLVLTHAHEDHSGGMRAVIENFRPRELWVGAMAESPAWNGVRAAAREFGVKIVAPKTGMLAEWGGVRLETLAPFPDQEPSAVPHNRDSLVLRATYGRHSFLLTGDLEKEVEQRLAEEGRLQPVTVLKVGHHGSRTSSTPEFLQATRPAIALVSAGQENLFRHPHSEVVERLQQQKTAIFRTDERGLIRVLSNGRQLEVRCWPYMPIANRKEPLSAW